MEGSYISIGTDPSKSSSPLDSLCPRSIYGITLLIERADSRFKLCGILGICVELSAQKWVSSCGNYDSEGAWDKRKGKER